MDGHNLRRSLMESRKLSKLTLGAIAGLQRALLTRFLLLLGIRRDLEDAAQVLQHARRRGAPVVRGGELSTVPPRQPHRRAPWRHAQRSASRRRETPDRERISSVARQKELVAGWQAPSGPRGRAPARRVEERTVDEFDDGSHAQLDALAVGLRTAAGSLRALMPCQPAARAPPALCRPVPTRSLRAHDLQRARPDHLRSIQRHNQSHAAQAATRGHSD